MTEQTDAPQPPHAQPPAEQQPPADPQQAEGAREPADSPQRRLVETVAAYEVDPPAPARVQEDEPGA